MRMANRQLRQLPSRLRRLSLGHRSYLHSRTMPSPPHQVPGWFSTGSYALLSCSWIMVFKFFCKAHCSDFYRFDQKFIKIHYRRLPRLSPPAASCAGFRICPADSSPTVRYCFRPLRIMTEILQFFVVQFFPGSPFLSHPVHGPSTR